MKLLTPAFANAKTSKDVASDLYVSAILHLAPASISGYEVCPARTPQCSEACLNLAGRGKFPNVQAARVRKTRQLHESPIEFMQLLAKDVNSLRKRAVKIGKTPVVRLNGTSDLNWCKHKLGGMHIFDWFPDVKFYDYTKLPQYVMAKRPANYHLTFSRSESNWRMCNYLLGLGNNVAVVFRNKLPATYKGWRVIDGTKSDLRILDPKGVVVGLIAKGPARKQDEGFVVEVSNGSM